MKSWTLITLFTVSLLLFSGCVQKPRPAEKTVVDATLPVVTLTENGVVAGMSSIAFEWQSVNDPRVQGIYIYRQNMKKGDASQEYYDTIDNRFATHYVDTKIDPDTKYSYSFKTYSQTGESLKSSPKVINSLPVLKSVSWIHSIENMPRSAKILWKPHDNQGVQAYIIERRTLESDSWKKVATVEGRFNAEYIDTKLEDKHVYKYRIRVLTYSEIISEPSEIVTSVTKALPNGVTNIVATRDLPKKIKLGWEHAKDVKDFAAYNVYKSSKINGNYKLLKSIKENGLTDLINEDGKNYFYKVSVVDKDGLESDTQNQSVQGQTLLKPSAPSITEAKLVDNKVIISWSATDSRIKNYLVTKTEKKNFFQSSTEEFTGISSNTFVDSAIEPETSYIYHVYGVDQNAIRSEPSIEVKFTTTKTQGKVINKTDKKRAPTKAPSSIDAPRSVPDMPAEETVQPMQDIIEF